MTFELLSNEELLKYYDNVCDSEQYRDWEHVVYSLLIKRDRAMFRKHQQQKNEEFLKKNPFEGFSPPSRWDDSE